MWSQDRERRMKGKATCLSLRASDKKETDKKNTHIGYAYELRETKTTSD